jgi:hypothetical protein
MGKEKFERTKPHMNEDDLDRGDHEVFRVDGPCGLSAV